MSKLPDIVISNSNGEKFSALSDQGNFSLDLYYEDTHFKGEKCTIQKIAPTKVNGRDAITITILPGISQIINGETEEKLESNID